MTDETASLPSSVSPTRTGFLSALIRSPKGLSGLILVLFILFCAIAGPWIMPHDPVHQSLFSRFAPTVWQEGGSAKHLLGGDNMGRDILSRTIAGARISVQVAVIVVSIALVAGSLLGALAGFFGGWLDTVIMRIVDFQLAFPFLLLALIFMAVLGPGFTTLVVALSMGFWINFARVVRSETLRIRKLDYIDAAITMGVSRARIILTHVLPNVLPAMLVVATLDVALVVLSEAGLSFLGLGVQPPTISWGMMIADGRDYLYQQPWIVIAPGIAVLMTSVGINLFGDFMRDHFDPRLERTRT
ncbi:ABC transporter permease [Chachezhania sediminis]|uniref:ABC transporter permease n=1 Tax=Chachezhania sediminis TaxID=2599291 RepID=UPI00131D0D95|nr:ABC transporter permease [Chachezhania sediminis]